MYLIIIFLKTLLLRACAQFPMSASHRVFLENYRGFFCSFGRRRPAGQLVKRYIRETGSTRYVLPPLVIPETLSFLWTLSERVRQEANCRWHANV